MTAAFAKLCPWIATSSSFRSTVCGPIVGEELDVVRQRQAAGHLVGRVVVAGDDEDRDLVVAQPAEFLLQVEHGAEIAPIAIVEVAGDQHEIDAFLDGQVDQPREGPPGRPADPIRRARSRTAPAP